MATSVRPLHYVIADLHLGHKIVTREGFRSQFKTVQEHDDFIIDRINSTCTKNDYLWVLGDAAFTGSALYRLRELKCHLGLIMGNHDIFSIARYSEVFAQVKPMMDFQCEGYPRGILTHIPIHESELDRWKFNIHGHTHDRKYDDSRYIGVSCEQIDYTPVRVASLLWRN